ncbi:hypothetical protein [Streptomyces sp. NPDC058451]|uniref:hypothetical protein n=1 Tax=Streptomyces sp. NPDC058451 TaxID=3346506 RepID=UPI00365B67F8
MTVLRGHLTGAGFGRPSWQKGSITMNRTRIVLPVVGAALASVAITACGGSGGSSGSAGSGNSSTGGRTNSSSPAAPATESNPAGDIPDNQAYVAFAPTRGGFSVKVPEGWARTGKGTVTSFTDKLNRVEVTPVSAASAPTTGSVTAQTVPQLRRTVPHFALGKVSVVSRHAGKVVLLTYQGDSAPDPVTGKVVRDAFERYAFYRQGHEVDVTLSGPVDADNVDPWRVVTDSFTWR